MNIATALDLLNKSFAKHGLSDWTGGLDNSRQRFGLCQPGKKHISLSRPLCELNSEDEVRDTILHEIAHALAWQRHGEGCGHDKRWKAICVEIGARPIACFDNEVIQPTAPWVLVHCETGEVFRSYYNRPKRDWSNIWIRGRKAETHGKLEIRSTASRPDSDDAVESGLIKYFDQRSVHDFRQELLAQVREFAEQYGLDVSNTKGQYSDRECHMTLSFKVPAVEGEDPQREEFEAIAPAFDLTPEDYLRQFKVNGREFQLTGLKIRNRKYPVIGMDAAGQQYKFELSVLDQLMASS